jgi:hypothetical protein
MFSEAKNVRSESTTDHIMTLAHIWKDSHILPSNQCKNMRNLSNKILVTVKYQTAKLIKGDLRRINNYLSALFLNLAK